MNTTAVKVIPSIQEQEDVEEIQVQAICNIFNIAKNNSSKISLHGSFMIHVILEAIYRLLTNGELDGWDVKTLREGEIITSIIFTA